MLTHKKNCIINAQCTHASFKYRNIVNLNTYTYLKSVVMYQQLWSFLPLFPLFCHYMPYSYSMILAYGKKQLLFKMSSIHMGSNVPAQTEGYVSSRSYSFWALKNSKTYNDTKYCKEAKTIIDVDIWLNFLIK